MSDEFNNWQKNIQKDCKEQYHGPTGYYRCNLNVLCTFEDCPLKKVNKDEFDCDGCIHYEFNWGACEYQMDDETEFTRFYYGLEW